MTIAFVTNSTITADLPEGGYNGLKYLHFWAVLLLFTDSLLAPLSSCFEFSDFSLLIVEASQFMDALSSCLKLSVFSLWFLEASETESYFPVASLFKNSPLFD